KKEQPIFNTPNFTMDVSNANGIKSIHLSMDSTTGDDIGYVVVIGNFGMETEEVDPGFQVTGTWYDLMNGNMPLEVTNVSAPISLVPGEFFIYGDKPFIDPDDLDSDGVANSDDLCNDTPLGISVDVFGCEVFTLPSDNFLLSVTSETCRNANNGKINISATAAMAYSATLSGPNNYSRNTDFTTALSLENLEAGLYNLCFGLDGQTSYKQCFDISIGEPEDLSVSSKIDRSSKNMSLSLKGGALYYVTLNGVTSETREQDLVLQLKSGMNSISIDTGVLCQGTFETRVFVSEDLSFFPNPVGSELSIYCGGSDRTVEITIYDFTGRILYRENREIASDRIVRIGTSHLTSGKYVASVKGETINESFKIIK